MEGQAGGQEPDAGGQEPDNSGQQSGQQQSGQQSDSSDQGGEPTGNNANLSPEDAKAALAAARKEAAKHRNELRSTQARLKALEDEKLSADEKLQRRLDELEKENTTLKQSHTGLLVGQAVQAAATKAGAIHPDAVAKLVDSADVKLDDDGTVQNADEAVAKIKSSYPSLFRGGAGSADGGARGPGPGKPDMNAWLRGEKVAP